MNTPSSSLTVRQRDVYVDLKSRLDAMAAGERVPTVRQLMREYGVSQISINRVLERIRRDIPLVSRVGDGTYKGDGQGEARPATIQLLLPDYDSQVLARMRRCLREVVAEAGFRLVTAHYPWQRFPAKWALSDDVVAVLVYPSAPIEVGLFAALQSCPVPVVMLDVIPVGSAVDAVGTDNEYGGELAAEHLLNQGYARLAMLMAEPENHPNTQARLRGFSRRAQLAGVAPVQPIYCHTPSGTHAAATAYEAMMQQLSAGKPSFDGLFVDSVSGAMGVLTACHRRGLTLPDDLAVLCFDDPPESAFVQPSLTTIRQDFGEWARQALEIVRRRRAGDAAGPLQVATRSQLVVRESTGGQFHYTQPQALTQVTR